MEQPTEKLTPEQQEEALKALGRAIFLSSLSPELLEGLALAERIRHSGRVTKPQKELDQAA